MYPANREFVGLMNAAGWSQAETARKLALTRGGVNGIVKGRTKPSEGTLKLFKLILASEQPEAVSASDLQFKERYSPVESWAEDLIGSLRELSEEDREKMLTAFQAMLGTIPERRKVIHKGSRR